jgi:hypothetical protein
MALIYGTQYQMLHIAYMVLCTRTTIVDKALTLYFTPPPPPTHTDTFRSKDLKKSLA